MKICLQVAISRSSSQMCPDFWRHHFGNCEIVHKVSTETLHKHCTPLYKIHHDKYQNVSQGVLNTKHNCFQKCVGLQWVTALGVSTPFCALPVHLKLQVKDKHIKWRKFILIVLSLKVYSCKREQELSILNELIILGHDTCICFLTQGYFHAAD
jgi:hypothetical protein